MNVFICTYVRLVNITTKSRFEIFNLKRFHNNEFPGQLNEKEYSRINSVNAKEKKIKLSTNDARLASERLASKVWRQHA